MLDTVEDERKKSLGKTAKWLDRAILTLRAQPDREAVLLYRISNAWPESVPDPQAYGYNEARPPRFKPTPTDCQYYLDVLDWLVWLEGKNDGKRDSKIIVSRAYGCPWWKLAARHGRAERTIRRWYDLAVTQIEAKFRDKIQAMPEIT